MESIFSAYADECLARFEKVRSVKDQVVEISRIKSAFENAIDESEKTEAFKAIVLISTKIMKNDLDRLSKKEERKRQRLIEKGISKPKMDIEDWRLRTAEHATKSFLRNTGFYQSLWTDCSVDIPKITDTLNQYQEKPSSQKIIFYVFDGVTLRHEKDEVNNISLPVGEIKKYNAEELSALFRLPQSHIHRNVDEDLPKRVSEWHVLSASEDEDYRGITGLWINGNLVSVIGFHDFESRTSNKETKYIGPLFIFLGTDMNLAEEIVIRTNIFDTLPVYSIKRDNYLEWQPDPYDGEDRPQRHVIEVGESGKKIQKLYEIWRSVNSLEKNSFLIFPTAHYIRTILNKDRIYEEDPSLFVNLVTITESLLNPGIRMELAHKTAMRGASLLTQDPEMGFQDVVIATDHGFFLNTHAEAGDVCTKPTGNWMIVHDRFALGDGTADDANFVLPAEQLGIRGDFGQASGPRGLVPYRAGELYFHGGASLQECVVPVLSIKLGERQTEPQKPKFNLSYKNEVKRITTRLPVIDVELVSKQIEMFPQQVDFELLLEAHDKKGNVVGEAKAGGPVNPATGTITMKPGERIQVTVKMLLEFEGKFSVKAMNPKNFALYCKLDLEDVVLRSVGLEPSKLTSRLKFHYIARLAPLVEANFNFIELGPRGTGKSYFFSEFSPYSTLISGGQSTKAVLFYNNARKKVGLVGFWDTVAFDEIAGIKIKDPDTIQIMKDYMANGRFSRGVEIIADASMAFVGNIDHSIEQIVRSTDYDLFLPLPKEFDLAIMDRFACYVPGWEFPKNTSEYLTDNYGFITDYLAEAFHYQLKHTNRYEEVSNRIRFGKSIEGRDEKGIKKTLCAFLKILHPLSAPTDDEFEEYVAYALEVRRRIKEQMNKRKPDDEFANINLSFFTTKGKETVVYCPESKKAQATQQPVRKKLDSDMENEEPVTAPDIESHTEPETTEKLEQEGEEESAVPNSDEDQEPHEQHYTIFYGDTGHGYDSIIGPYLKNAKEITVEDPYVRVTHQIQNFVRFCEIVVKLSMVRKINLITSYDDKTNISDMRDNIEEVKQSLLEIDVVLDIKLNPNMHDREIRIDNGWTIKIGRGLDFYQKPDSWFAIGVNDLSLRRCLETKVDIYKKGKKAVLSTKMNRIKQ